MNVKKYGLLSIIVIAAVSIVWILFDQEDKVHSQSSSLQSVESQPSSSLDKKGMAKASQPTSNPQALNSVETTKKASQDPQPEELKEEIEEHIAQQPQDPIPEAVRQAREEKVRAALDIVRQRTAQISRADIVAEQQKIKKVREDLVNIEVKPPQLEEFTDEAGIKWNKLTYENGEVKYELISFPE
ncbi:hypothetical protein [Zooshikella harenae]|uniref:Uncharacterized protein n=1 Tax=Zooshikella harenae TaxID=2827238 RepID=A0ABS5Z8R4_9GAMM|nr:hypothetical protein [Zooshikella harenae]MBU2710419.1 hypothetical protein [Zooshikella harenae]